MISFLLLALPLLAQAPPPEDPGPSPVGWEIVYIPNPSSSVDYKGRLYYPAVTAGRSTPADPTAGPYPVVGFMHGNPGRAREYDEICTHVASYGFLVASIDSATTPNPVECQIFLHWVEEQSEDLNSWLSSMAREGSWAAMGHSGGGMALAPLTEIEPRIQTIIGLASGPTSNLGISQIADYAGSAAWIGGTVDPLFSDTRAWYEAATATERNLYIEIPGAGHYGSCDLDVAYDQDPMTRAEQHRIHRKLIVSILRAEMLSKDSEYEWIVGSFITGTEPWNWEHFYRKPALWGGLAITPIRLEMGILGENLEKYAYAGSLALGTFNTPLGTGGLDLSQGRILGSGQLNSNGHLNWIEHLPSGLSGMTVYAQAGLYHLNGGMPVGSLTNVLHLQIP